MAPDLRTTKYSEPEPSRRRGGSTPFRLSRRSDTTASRHARSLEAEISPVWEDVAPQMEPASAARYSVLYARDALFRRGLALADVIGAYLALFVAVAVHKGPISIRPEIVLIGPFVVLTSKAIGLYDRDQNRLRKTTIDELPSILYLALAYTGAAWLSEELLLRGWLDRPDVLALAVASCGFIATGRIVARHAALRMVPPERCAVLGGPSDAARITEKFESSPGVNATVVGRFSVTGGEATQSPVAGEIHDPKVLRHVIDELDAERVIIAPGGHDQDEVLHAIRILKAFGVKVSVVPRLLEVVGSSSTFDEVDGVTLLGVRQYGLSKSSELLKRSMDIAGASAALLLFGPVLLLLALAVKLDSRGPVFFRQPRIGRRGQRFEMIKFRSMVRGADRMKDELRRRNEAEGGLFKITDDPRITRVGRLLRRSSLDELPQLLNVVMGHMSLVGPRPLVPDEDALIEGWQRRRLAVRPGMTGMWQVYGSSRIPMPEMVKIDYLYGANWSIWLDLKILLRTVPYILRRRGL